MYFYWGVCKEPDQNSISRSMFWFFGFLSLWRVKNSYLIRPSSENSNFLWEMLFLCPKQHYKISWKNTTSKSLFLDFMLAGKIHPFFYKTGNGTSSIYRGSTLTGYGWAWLGDCLGCAQAPPAIPHQAAPPKSAPFSTIWAVFINFFW